MHARPVIYYRRSQMPKEELTAALDAGFRCVCSRMSILPEDLVVGRYSVLPFYLEQEHDIRAAEARLINSLREHEFVADLRNYVARLKEMTPETWFSLAEAPKEGPYILKGATNSKKHQWATHMFAKDWEAATRVHGLLQEDGLIGTQDIYVRRYVPLKKLGESISGLPLTEEFRFFVCRGKIISGGFYWDAFHDDILEQNGAIPSVSDVPKDFLEEAIKRIGDNCTFYAIDVARTEKGDWIVIELNDGQMSGLSANDPVTLYTNLFDTLTSDP